MGAKTLGPRRIFRSKISAEAYCIKGALVPPDTHLTRLIAMSSVRSRLADLKASQSSGLILDDQYTTHCDRVLSALHDRPPETPPRPNATNATNAANTAQPPQTSSPSKSQRSMANSMAYSDPDGLAEYSVILSPAELAGLDIQSQNSHRSAATQVSIPSSALPELSPERLPDLPVLTPPPK